MKIEIILSEAESKALSYVAVDPYAWAENAVRERCRLAIDEIFNAEIDRMIKDPSITEIPADKTQVVLTANIKTAAERHNDFLQSLESE